MFVEFSIEWNARAADADPDEYDAYRDLVGGNDWSCMQGGERLPIHDAPSFFAADECSWVLAAS